MERTFRTERKRVERALVESEEGTSRNERFLDIYYYCRCCWYAVLRERAHVSPQIIIRINFFLMNVATCAILAAYGFRGRVTSKIAVLKIVLLWLFNHFI